MTLNKLLQLAILAPFTISLAFAGDKAGNGGDPNEIKFKSVALNIAQWIESGNAEGLALPAGISNDAYRARMLEALGNYDIEFTNETIRVGGGEKTCRNIRESDGRGKITCHSPSFGRFYAENIDDIYRIVHHEFAGLAGFEESRGQDSDYRISDQLSVFLRTELVKRLPVRPSNEQDPFWLPATGWRRDLRVGGPNQAPVPFLLDYRNQESVEDLRKQGGYRSVARLFQRDISLSAEDAQTGRIVEVRSEGAASISRKDGDRRFDASIGRMPERSAEENMAYECTLVETGEKLIIVRGSGPVEIPSQKNAAGGRIVITTAKGAFFISQIGADGSDAVVKILRGVMWASAKFSGGGQPARSFACEISMSTN